MSISSRTSFLIAVVVLGLCAITMQGASQYLELHFRKEKVDLKSPLESIPEHLGPWTQVTADRALTEDEEHVLGTNKYLMRVYVDTRVISKELLASLKDKTDEDRNRVIGGIQKEHPEAVVAFMVTYYTGMADTVSHVPDRCYIADGYDVNAADELKWSKSDKSVRYLTFEDATGVGRVRKNVAYLFSVNDRYVADPIDVRRIMGNLFARYGYYAKVELMTQQLEREQAAQSMDDFLSHALPALKDVLPDWTQYQGK